MAGSDDRKRKLERDVAANPEDRGLVELLERERARTGDSDYGHFIGRWVSVFGVRQHYRGRLLKVQYGPLGARLFMHPLYDLESCETVENQQKLPTSVECPGVLVETAILAVTLQLTTLPEE